MNLAQPERVLKAIIRLLEEHKASMIFTCVEEANRTEYDNILPNGNYGST